MRVTQDLAALIRFLHLWGGHLLRSSTQFCTSVIGWGVLSLGDRCPDVLAVRRHVVQVEITSGSV